MSTISASTTSTTAYKVTADTTGTLVLQTGASPTTAMTIDGSQNVILAGNITLNNGAADGAQLSLSSAGFSDWNIDNYSGNFRWYYNATEYMRLNNSGNLGLGVTPSAWSGSFKAIEVGGLGSSIFGQTAGNNTWVTANAYFNGSNWIRPYAASASAFNLSSGTAAWYTAGSSTAGSTITFTQAMTLDASGNLGVGATSPSTRLHIKSAGSTYMLSENSSNSVSTYFGSETGNGAVYVATNHPLAFYTNSTERARIDSSGNLLVGTTSVAGSERFRVYTTSAEGVNFSNNDLSGSTIVTKSQSASASTHYVLAVLNSAGTAVGRITHNDSNTTFATSSDYRLKENVAPMTGALATVSQLKPCTYTWKADGSDGQGFIAHELQAVVPDAVVGEKDAVETYIDDEGNEQTRPVYQGIDTSFLVATLTAAIQEQQAIIETLTNRITALENK